MYASCGRALMGIVVTVISFACTESPLVPTEVAAFSTVSTLCSGPDANARLYNDTFDCLDGIRDGIYAPAQFRANDRIVINWNEEYNSCASGGSCDGAWYTNQSNGSAPGGSGTSDHWKVIWVATCDAAVEACVGTNWKVLSAHVRFEIFNAVHIWFVGPGGGGLGGGGEHR